LGRIRRQYGASSGTSNGASRETRDAEEGRIVNGLVTTDKQAIVRVFGTTIKPRWDRDVTNRGLRHQSYKLSKLRPTSTESLTP